MTPQAALDRIAALCDEARSQGWTGGLVPEIEAVLADVTPDAGGWSAGQAADRDALGAAWDDGNAVGLDGWRGPGRGEDVDPGAVRARERYLDEHALVRPVKEATS